MNLFYLLKTKLDTRLPYFNVNYIIVDIIINIDINVIKKFNVIYSRLNLSLRKL